MREIINLKNALLTSILVVIFIVGGIRLTLDLERTDDTNEIFVSKHVHSFELMFLDKLKDIENVYTTNIETMLLDEELLDSIDKKDRDKVFNKLKDTYSIFKKIDPDLVVFHIHDKDNLSLVRFHNPEKFGDNVHNKRQMLQTAILQKNTIYGLERCFSKNHLIYRAVKPIYQGTKYLGMIEFGISLDNLANELSENINKMTMSPNHIRAAIYKNEAEAKHNNTSKSTVSDDTILVSNSDELNEIVRESFKNQKKVQNINYKNRVYSVFKNNISLSDFRSDQLAKSVIVVDITKYTKDRKKQIQDGITKPLIAIGILFSLVVLFFNKIIKRFGEINNKIQNNYNRVRTILDSQSNIIIITSGKELLEANRAFFDFLGFKDIDEFKIDHSCICDFFQTDKSNNDYLQPKIGDYIWSEYVKNNPKMLHKAKIKGRIFAVHMDSYLSEETLDEYIVVFTDISDMEKHQKQLHNLAYIDSLTGIPNRADFLSTLKLAIDEYDESCECRYVLMFLDLDGFKQINDVHGHDVGDSLLKHVAKKIIEIIGNEYYVARLGGDEFVLFLKNCKSNSYISVLANKLIDSISKEVVIGFKKINIGVSIGISLYPQDANNLTTFLKNSDIAMYNAKANGRNRFEFYSKNMGEKIHHEQQISNDLKAAIKNNEFYLVYQPQLDVKTGRLVGVEALIRWIHPKLGEVFPNQFISIAESTDMIIDIGTWVINRAIDELKPLIDKYNFNLSINITNREIVQNNYVDNIKEILKNKDFNPNHLELEFIERDALKDVTHTQRVVSVLAKDGVKFSLDDFGTGYSSLSYINRLDIDTLKIDRSFIQDIDKRPNQLAIVKSIMSMGHNINFKVLAEGVETQDEYDVLVDLGCDTIQGYFFSKPLKLEKLESYLIAN